MAFVPSSYSAHSSQKSSRCCGVSAQAAVSWMRSNVSAGRAEGDKRGSRRAAQLGGQVFHCGRMTCKQCSLMCLDPSSAASDPPAAHPPRMTVMSRLRAMSAPDR